MILINFLTLGTQPLHTLTLSFPFRMKDGDCSIYEYCFPQISHIQLFDIICLSPYITNYFKGMEPLMRVELTTSGLQDQRTSSFASVAFFEIKFYFLTTNKF